MNTNEDVLPEHNNQMIVKKVLTLLAPLLATPVLFLLISEEYLNLGAGCKDIVILLPWLLWSVIFLITGLILWKKKLSIKHWMFRTTSYSVLFIVNLWLCLFLYSVITTM